MTCDIPILQMRRLRLSNKLKITGLISAMWDLDRISLPRMWALHCVTQQPPFSINHGLWDPWEEGVELGRTREGKGSSKIAQPRQETAGSDIRCLDSQSSAPASAKDSPRLFALVWGGSRTVRLRGTWCAVWSKDGRSDNEVKFLWQGTMELQDFKHSKPLRFFEKLGQLTMLNTLFAWNFLPGTAFHTPQTSLLPPRGLNGLTMLPKVNDQNYAKSQGNENPGKCPSLRTTHLPSRAKVLRHENQSTLTQTPWLLHMMKGFTWKEMKESNGRLNFLTTAELPNGPLRARKSLCGPRCAESSYHLTVWPWVYHFPSLISLSCVTWRH